jgi:chemotaxis protein MotB
MTNALKRGLFALPLIAPVLLSACVSQSSYDALQAQYQQLQQQSAAQTAQIRRLQGAIKYTVNSDLLFAPGSWEMRPAGKDIIAKMAAKLAPTQQNQLLVNGYTDNAPIGPALRAQGVNSNQVLSQKRAESVMAFLVSRGVNPALLAAKGYGEDNPVASNDTARGRSQNRRVELTLAGS